MGLPIWVEPSERKVLNSCCAATSSTAIAKPPADLTSHHGASRSSIRRQASVRYPHGSRPGHVHPLSHAYLRGSLRSPPPAPPSRPIPPVPSLPSQRERSRDRRRPNGRSLPDVVVLPATTDDDEDQRERHSPRHTPFFSEVSHTRPRPRSRRGTITNERPVASPGLIDELPPLRRMNRRSINDRSRSRSRSPQTRPRNNRERHYPSESENESAPEDHHRSPSPDADQWETLLTTITPDPSLPVSAETSFNSAATSFPDPPPQWAQPSRRHRPQPWFHRSPRLRPAESPLSPHSQPPPPRDPFEIAMSRGPFDLGTPSPPLTDSPRPLDPNTRVEPPSTVDPTTLQSPISSSDSTNPDIQALYTAIHTLRDRTDRLVSSFCSLADSFHSSSAADLGPIHEGTSDENPPDNSNEIRALVEDVNALHNSLERTVRSRAEARAHRVSRGADPLAAVRGNTERLLREQTRPPRRSVAISEERRQRMTPMEMERELLTLDEMLQEDRERERADRQRPRSQDPEMTENNQGDGMTVTQVLEDTDGVLTRLRSSDDTIRESALAELPTNTRRIVLGALERSRSSIYDPPSSRSRTRRSPSHPSYSSHHHAHVHAHSHQHQHQRERSERGEPTDAQRLASARESLSGMEAAITEMETMASEPGATARQLSELGEARERLERMRGLLRAVEVGEGGQ